MKGGSTQSSARLATLEGLFAFAMALGSVMYGNSARIPAGEWHRFLETRVTVLNAMFAGLFMLAWNYSFTALDLYRVGPMAPSVSLFEL